MPLRLDRRSCTIGSSINTRTEKHGDEDVAALDIPISKVCLSETEFGDVLCDPRAHKLLFVSRKGQLARPRFVNVLGTLPFRAKVPGVDVTIHFPGAGKLKMTDVSLTTCRLDRQEGGTTWWSFKIQCTPDLDESIEKLLAHLNQPVDIEITCETYGAQTDLFEGKDEETEAGEQTDLEDEAGAPEGSEDEEPGMSRLGRQISSSRRKRSRH